jgi:hypothetical protein
LCWHFCLPCSQFLSVLFSLYFYAKKSKLSVRFCTAETGIVQSDRAVLETLAAVNIADQTLSENQLLKDLPDLPVVWLTHRNDSLAYLPMGSRWVLWQSMEAVLVPNQRSLGLTIESITDPNDANYRDLRSQLQGAL